MSDTDFDRLKRDYERAICRIVLYCIMELPMNYGVHKTIAVLRGSYSTFMIDHDLNQSDINTYALLSNFSNTQLRDIIDILIQAGLIKREYVTSFQMPVLTVAEQGYSFIRGEYAADIQFIENLFQHDLPQIESNDMELFQQLRTLRKDIAKDLQIPAYWICIDRALFDLTRKKPTTKEDLLSVHGIGDTFVEKYGERFIETINCYLSTVYENTNIIDQDKQNSDICSQPAISPSIEAVAIKDDAINKRLEAEFVKLLKEMLSERESTVVIMRLGLADGYSRTLAEIGEMLGVTRERIRQIEKKALRRLRHPSKKINIPGDFDIVKFRKDPSIYDSLFNTLNERLPFKTDSSQNNGRQSADSTEQDDREQPSAISMVGQAWTSEEDERLIKSFDAGSSIEDLASRHRRNWGGIRARLNRFGRVVEEKEDIQSKLDK